jgi:hypothetical protein
MKVRVECANFGVQNKADVAGIIRTIIECAERDSIYGGFICNDCAGEQDDETRFED